MVCCIDLGRLGLSASWALSFWPRVYLPLGLLRNEHLYGQLRSLSGMSNGQCLAVSVTYLFSRRRLFRDFRFIVLFFAGAAGTFPLFVPPFFLPLYGNSLHLSSSTTAGLVAAFNFSSAVGRLCCGLLSDFAGPLNTLFFSLFLSAVSMLVLWPVSNSFAPLVAFAIINGMANGGFFSTMPTVVGSVFGSARVSVAMGMIITGWGGGYLMVRYKQSFIQHVDIPLA